VGVMANITAKKKGQWQGRLYAALKGRCNAIHDEISNCGVSDDDVDSLANLTCFFDEAIAEVDALRATKEVLTDYGIEVHNASI